MSDPNNAGPDSSDDPFEYVGHLKFEPAEGGPITPKTTMEDWEDSARHEYIFNLLAVFILNCNDEELERWVLEKVNAKTGVSFLTDTAEHALDLVDKKKAGVDVYNSVFSRCMVIAERIEARHLGN